MSRAERLVSRIAVVVLLAGLLYALVLCAWQCDDAWITFRTVRNAWTGRGLGFQPHERVQAYTHPLWMLLVALAYGITRDVFVTVTVLSVVLGVVAGAVLASVPRDRPWRSVALVAILVASRAYVEFSVCGLENPLLFLVVASVPFILRAPESRHVRDATLVLSIAFLVRPDAVLLVLPMWIDAVVRRRQASNWKPVALGLSPAIAWECFSLVYYGAFVPNTALAKLNLHVPRMQLLVHGVSYLADSLHRDPVTLPAIALATTLAFARGDRAIRITALGVVLYVAYVVAIGGDFMSGRFLGAPLVLSLGACAGVEFRRDLPTRRAEPLVAVLALATIAAFPNSPARTTLRFGRGAPRESILGPTGIADERAYYYPNTGFLPVMLDRPQLEASGLPIPPHPGAVRGAAFARTNERATVYNEIGFFGWFAGDKEVIDRWGLADPLLARIPFRAESFARVGHFARSLPDGYLESRRSGTNRIADPALHEAYADIVRVTHEPLISSSRWRAIVRLLFGRHRRAFERAASASR